MGLRLEYTCEFCNDVKYFTIEKLSNDPIIRINSSTDSKRATNIVDGWFVTSNPAVPYSLEYIVMCNHCWIRAQSLKKEAEEIKNNFIKNNLRKPRLESDKKMREKERIRARDGQ